MKSIVRVIIVLIWFGVAAYAQNHINRRAELAARKFYENYLPIYGFPDESGLRRLRLYLSEYLYSG